MVAGAVHAEELQLQAFVNGVDQRLIVRVEQLAGALYLSREDLVALGLDPGELPPPTDHGIDLGQIHGLRAEYGSHEQRLDLQVPDSALATQMLSFDDPNQVAPRSDSGLVFDYSLHWQENSLTLAERVTRTTAPRIDDGFGPLPLLRAEQHEQAYEDRNRTLTLSSALRWFAPWGLIQNRGYWTHESDETSYVRDDTYWTYSTPESMRTYVIGDFIGTPLTWTRALRLGGARVGRNFGLRPDLVTFALPTLGGSAVVPTTVDLYVNGMRRFSAEARPGPFVIAEAPPLTGAGNVAIVYQDALGRQVVATQPLYVDTRLLETGFMDYDVEFGYPRHDYGTASFEYGEDPAAIGSLRYGINDAFTLEAHTELAEMLQVIGAGVLWKPGDFGVLSAALAASDADENGWLTSAGYQYISSRWSVDVYDRRTHGNYGDLGTLEDVPVPRRLTRASMNVWITASQALTANYAEQITSTSEVSRVGSLGYRGTFRDGRLGVYLNVFRDFEIEDSDGFYLAFSLGFGTDSSAYSSASRYGEERTATFGAARPVDYDRGGFGWNLQAEGGNDDYRRGSLQVDYRANFADMGIRYEESSTGEEEADNVSVFGAGSLVMMRGGIFAARSIYDGFALVSSRGLPGIPVLRENRELGVTNRRGYLLVPDLPSWRSSKIGIDLTNAPVDVASGISEVRTNPRAASGVIVEFPIERMNGATMVLVDAAFRPLPAGTRVTLAGSGASSLVGYDGQVFFPALGPVNRLSAELDDGTCEAEVHFEFSQVMRIIGPFVCEAGNTP